MRDGKKAHKTDGQRYLKKFLSIVFAIVGCFIVISSFGVFAFFGTVSAEEYQNAGDHSTIVGQGMNKSNTSSSRNSEGGFFSNLLVAPKKTNFVILGNDQTDMLADVIILGSFDRDTCEINLVNIPRDTYTTISAELRKDLEDAGRWIPQAMKLNELHSYAGRALGGEAVKRKLEESFSIKIDYIIDLDLDGFKKIVDVVGPIEMEIPQGGMYYYDPVQNLRISIPGGTQMLNGEMAEGLVRYRATYRRGDLERIEMQQEFLKQLFIQTLQKENLIRNAAAIITTIFEFVDTDFELIELPKYLPYITQLSEESLITQTLPGEPRTLNGISYYIYDAQASQELMNEIFHTYADEGPEVLKAEYLSIQILNGSSSVVNALSLLEGMAEDGLNVMFGGNYDGDRILDTQIRVSREGQGEDLIDYFVNPQIVIDSKLAVEGKFDIVIIIGENEFAVE